jgi:glycosyltransferase involved in cell wall biosynthesis
MAMSYTRVVAPAIAALARQADVVHVWADGFLALAAVQAASSLGIPVLVTPFAHRDQWGTDVVSVRAYQLADRTIGLLEDNCDLLREYGAPPDRVVECPVCSPGVERGGGDVWRRDHNVTGPLVVFLGVRRPYKGFDLLVAAIPEIARALPEATVVFAGPGDTVDERQPLRVIDRGTVSDKERAALLDAADLLCLPSAGEIYPSSILEAWSAETPVLTSDIAPLAELMRRSGGGRVAPRDPDSISSAVVSMLQGPHRELGAAGYAYWSNYATVEAVVARHVELYREVVGERAVSAAGP